ncbi:MULTISPECIES: corrinoid activation/regeneration protein AcsV [unclassified Dehalobacter]|uniref:corrinoid activation/regeneration protein AcsV n=1 Tax=unclassified Dehalobacter TaxID=2635733 RepID=UPI000E6CF9AF|nr:MULTISPECIES: corrinoid activation/regeneration protein AcsV [unclassified Dehalobacter]RJE47837.1 ferredoxin [Dehalobacter sp. MCB1]TCX49011.1 ferredoxin [Dehalobacter sp. 14DCB1]TCX56667.1 ferredoxin [Dehalobacter sp. 12DCB1]
MFKVKFIPENTVVIAKLDETLFDAAHKAGIFLDAPCNGLGSCGKCKLKVLKGSVNFRKNHHITESELAQGFVLACNSKINGDITIEVPAIPTSIFSEMKIEDLAGTKDQQIIDRVINLATNNHILFNSAVQKTYMKLDLPSLDDCISDWDRIKRHLLKNSAYREVICQLPIFKKIPHVLRENDFHVTVTYFAENSERIRVINIEPGDTSERLYGAAIDVGTTSVAAFLVDLCNGKIIAKASAGNIQIKYGADVISRIIHATKKNGLQELTDAIIKETINPLLKQMRQEIGVSKDEISVMVASGNTTMMHLMLGVYPDYLRKDPYIPAFLDSEYLKAADLGLEAYAESLIYILPSVSSYVGGDITAGVLASGLWSEDQNILFMDLGTNGEIVFGNKDFLLTCACSAGPAFEGGEISSGMRAVPGVIENVRIDRKTFEPAIDTIDNQLPLGLCGSGIIDAIAEMFRAGIIDSRGRLNRNLKTRRIRFDEYGIGEFVLAFRGEYYIPKDITITEIDLENFIRAKGAVYSAVAVLLKSMGMDYSAIDKIYIAGGIGTNININNSITIGLFPDLPVEKFEYLGNSSLMGSYLTLRSTDARKKAEDIASHMTYLELSTDSSYMGEFISACFLPHTEIERFPTVKEQGKIV